MWLVLIRAHAALDMKAMAFACEDFLLMKRRRISFLGTFRYAGPVGAAMPTSFPRFLPLCVSTTSDGDNSPLQFSMFGVGNERV